MSNNIDHQKHAARALTWLPSRLRGVRIAVGADQNPDGDNYQIDLEPDDEGYFYLRINREDCREGDWRTSVAALKRVVNTYVKRNLKRLANTG